MHFTTGKPAVLIIIGPSGSGKSTAVRQLAQRQLVEVVPTWTTRPPRPDELAQSIEHRFVSEQAFETAVRRDLFLETRQMFGLPYWYGMPKVPRTRSGQPALIILRAPLVELFARHYANYIVYQVADSLQRVRQRLEARQANGEDIGSRLAGYEAELRLGNALAKRTFSNDTTSEALADKLAQAIQLDFE